MFDSDCTANRTRAMRAPLMAAAALIAASTPAVAQLCDCGFDSRTVAGPAYVVVPQTTYVPHTHYVPEKVLIPRTRYVPRTVYEPQTRLVPRTIEVPRTDFEVRTRYRTFSAYPAPGYLGAYPGGVIVLPLPFDHPCITGSIGCNPSLNGPLYDY